MSLRPIQAHAAVDALGVLDDCRDPGTYALAVPTPDSAEAVQRAWLDCHGTPLPDEYAVQLAEARETLYVGASHNDVYDRIMDHCEGKVRRASFVQAFGIEDIRGIWPEKTSPHDRPLGVVERDRARALSDANTVCWCDGKLF